MNVIGILVHTTPEAVTAVSTALAAMPGVDVHAATDDGRLVVTATDVGTLFASDSLMAMNQIAGVIGTSLVYHASEDDDLPGARAA